MQKSNRLKKSFKVSSSYSPIHTSGSTIQLTANEEWLFSILNDQVLVTELESGQRVNLLPGDTSPITTFSCTPSPSSPQQGGHLLTASQSLSLHIYSLPSLALSKHIPKAHSAPIITSSSDPTGSLFSTGSSDGQVKVWDAQKGHCTHVFKGHGGVISGLKFDVATPGSGKGKGRARLISASDDCSIRVWDLNTRECLHVLNGHVSVVRGLDLTPDGKVLISGGRDKVVNVWDLERGVLKKTIPVFETVETVGLLVAGEGAKKLIYTGGDKGVVRLWDLRSGELVKFTSDDKLEEPKSMGEGSTHETLNIIHTPSTSTLTVLYVDLNIISYQYTLPSPSPSTSSASSSSATSLLPSLSTSRTIIGFNDEIVSLSLLPNSGALAVATNSALIRVYESNKRSEAVEDGKGKGKGKFDVSLLRGHENVVLCLAAGELPPSTPDDDTPPSTKGGEFLVSGSKDKSVRVWLKKGSRWECVGVGLGHLESVGAIGLSKKLEGGFVISGSQDRTVKVWDLIELLSTSATSSANEKDDSTKLKSLTTLKAHDKDINSLDISPNDKLLLTGSQDRLAKLFSITYEPATKKGKEGAKVKLELVGTFKGHRRGIWDVKFSRNDLCVATASADRSVKVWNLNDFSCIKTFEGHSNSVLRVDFLSRGMQLVSSASDGLVKIWNVKNEECVATLDNHEDKVWALAISKDEEEIVSGGADSVISFWKDCTEDEEEERRREKEDLVLKEQDFDNYLQAKDYANAIVLALSLNQPKRLLSLFTSLRNESTLTPSTLTGDLEVDVVLKKLSQKDLKKLLGYVKDWNTNVRTCEVAQGVLFALFKLHSVKTILGSLEAKKDGVLDIEGDDADSDEEVNEEEHKRQLKSLRREKELSADEVLGALIPYTERHFNRIDKVVRETYLMEHLLGLMDGFEGGLGEVNEMVVEEGDEEDLEVESIGEVASP